MLSIILANPCFLSQSILSLGACPPRAHRRQTDHAIFHYNYISKPLPSQPSIVPPITHFSTYNSPACLAALCKFEPKARYHLSKENYHSTFTSLSYEPSARLVPSLSPIGHIAFAIGEYIASLWDISRASHISRSPCELCRHPEPKRPTLFVSKDPLARGTCPLYRPQVEASTTYARRVRAFHV